MYHCPSDNPLKKSLGILFFNCIISLSVFVIQVVVMQEPSLVESW